MSNKSKWQSWVWIRWKAGAPSTAWETWKNNPQIKGAWSTLGEWDSMLMVETNTPDELEEFVWKTIRTNTWVDSTQTTWAKHWF